MICLLVKLALKKGTESAAAAGFVKMTEATRKEPGCIFYQVHQHKDDPTRFMVYEQYKDDDALAAHRNSHHFQHYLTNDIYKNVEGREADLYRPI